MSTVNHAQRERAELCDLFERVGPGVPTLCEGWTARDLAAHLVVRERRPDAALGIVAAPLARHGEKVRLQMAHRSWLALVELVRSGPPRLSPFGLPPIDRAANTMEYFIHHEDVRRGTGRDDPRMLSADFEDQLWSVLRRMSRLMLRRAPTGVQLIAPGRSPVMAHTASTTVEVEGPVGELALFVYGRQAHALVDLRGPQQAVDALRSADLGI